MSTIERSYRVPVEIRFVVYVEVEAGGDREAMELARALVARNRPRLSVGNDYGIVRGSAVPTDFHVLQGRMCDHSPFCQSDEAHIDKLAKAREARRKAYYAELKRNR